MKLYFVTKFRKYILVFLPLLRRMQYIWITIVNINNKHSKWQNDESKGQQKPQRITRNDLYDVITKVFKSKNSTHKQARKSYKIFPFNFDIYIKSHSIRIFSMSVVHSQLNLNESELQYFCVCRLFYGCYYGVASAMSYLYTHIFAMCMLCACVDLMEVKRWREWNRQKRKRIRWSHDEAKRIQPPAAAAAEAHFPSMVCAFEAHSYFNPQAQYEPQSKEMVVLLFWLPSKPF